MASDLLFDTGSLKIGIGYGDVSPYIVQGLGCDNIDTQLRLISS